MLDNKMIGPNDEQSFPDLGISIKWRLQKVEAITGHPKVCALVMGLCSNIEGADDCGAANEVLGLAIDHGKADTVLLLENVISIPSTVIAKIGLVPGDTTPPFGEPSFYYAELTGISAVDAAKAIIGKIFYSGFSGTAVLGKKASFDPSPNRNWKIENASYSLRRGLTAEVLDIQAYQFDGFDGTDGTAYWDGCLQPANKRGKCEVAPWGQAHILEIVPK